MLFIFPRCIIRDRMLKKKLSKLKISPAGTVALSFLAIISIGTFLLSLPISSRGQGWTPFIDALFTATSATCVTGLAALDTFGFWAGFGQAVILLLIQIGGLGFITIVSVFAMNIKKDLTLTERKIFMQSAGGMRLSEIKKQVRLIIIGTFSIELVGAVLLSIAFIPEYGWGLGIWFALFTSVSAFCNAGFSLTENSLCAFVENPLVCLTVILLILIGGIGFFVWTDIVKKRHHITKYSFHTKIVLSATLLLTVLGWILFMLFEWNNPGTLGELSVGGKILASLFMSVTPRTAGFNTVDMTSLTVSSTTLTLVYMFIGGSPGSTAGGVKTTTFAVLVIAAIATSRRQEETHAFKRKFEGEAIYQASAIIMLHMTAILLSVLVIGAVEPGADMTFQSIMFEVISAISTVGLSLQITPELGVISKLILIALMFFGRVGGYTLVLVFSENRKPVKISHIAEQIIIG